MDIAVIIFVASIFLFTIGWGMFSMNKTDNGDSDKEKNKED